MAEVTNGGFWDEVVNVAKFEQRKADAAKLRKWADDACDDSAHLALLQAAAKLERGE